MKKKTTESFIDEAKKIHGNKYDYSKTNYDGSKKKVCIICPIHGEFWQIPNDHLRGHGCSKCNGGVKYTHEKWIEKFEKVHNGKYSYSLVQENIDISSNTKIPIICSKHGIFKQFCINHSLGQGCPKCANELDSITKRNTKEDFELLARKIHGDKYDYSKVQYVNNYTEVCIICPKHGEFWQKPNVHLLKHGCPKCSSSIMENDIIELLDTNGIRYIHRAKKNRIQWLERLELDFYLLEYNVAIECQGIEHFKPIEFFGGKGKYMSTVKRDEIKRKLCKENGIKLLYYSNLGIKYPYKVYENKQELLKEILNG